jgi:hypothetical protein
MIDENEVEVKLKQIGVPILTCRKCGRKMFWLKTIKGNNAPVTLELTNHFIDCKFANEFRKK